MFSSEQIATVAQQLFSTIGWALAGVLIFVAGTRLYDLLDPIDYRAEIKRGNVAAAIKLGAVTLGLAAIVVAAIVG